MACRDPTAGRGRFPTGRGTFFQKIRNYYIIVSIKDHLTTDMTCLNKLHNGASYLPRALRHNRKTLPIL